MAALCCKPCELLCQGCGELCKCIDKGCACCCKACQAPCDCMYKCCCPSDKPSPIFLTFSGIICGIAIILSVSGLSSSKSECNAPIGTFLIIGILINGALLGFAIYLYWQFSRPYGQAAESNQQSDNNPLARAGNMFCYDPVVFVYLLVLAGTFVMAIMGAIWLGQADKAKCSSGERSAASSVVTCMWIYLLAGSVVIMISLCVECARVKEVQNIQAAQHRPSISLMPLGPSGFMKRLFFPRHTVTVVQTHQPANIPTQNAYNNNNNNNNSNNNIPYAVPANQPPAAVNSQGPPGRPQQAWGAPNQQQQGQQPAQGGSSLAGLAAQGLRFGANLLAPKPPPTNQAQPQQGHRDLGNSAM
mmetsp:Transcript_46743/g.110050  ORF Transcript_46743/g.110050 Transcript_46743/m.110050 type:complete len:359 (+) Transcript_46743:57-1133(+)